MECKQSSIAKAAAPRKSRFPARDCLRKGCRCRFTPTSGRQRYCQDPDCLREVRRWHASRRQRVRRQRLEVRKADAVASRERRIRRSRIGQVPRVSPESVLPAASTALSGASSRNTGNPGPICDRVGCYEPPRTAYRCSSRYCSQECHAAMRRVRDRERKLFWRSSFAGQMKCDAEAQKRRIARRVATSRPRSTGLDTDTATTPDGVQPYRSPAEAPVVCGDRKEKVCNDVKDPEEAVASRSRPPPT